MHDDDLRLAKSLRQGDERSFRTFFDHYAPLLLGFVLRRSGLDRASAEDVVQSAMIRAVRALPGYRGEASLLTWLCQVCRSELADRHRASVRRPATVSYDQDEAAARAVAARAAHDAGIGPFDREGDPSGRVLEVLAALPPHHARVLEMKYASELQVGEIASRLGTTATAVQSQLARAREAFRACWRSLHGGEP